MGAGKYIPGLGKFFKISKDEIEPSALAGSGDTSELLARISKLESDLATVKSTADTAKTTATSAKSTADTVNTNFTNYKGTNDTKVTGIDNRLKTVEGKVNV
ncbi:hypothetical protein [Bacillus phage Nachito]|nr:hypothetical protein [Bacillus phage Nachito]